MDSKTIFAFALAAAALLLLVVAGASPHGTLSPNEELGKELFFDTKLSTPPGQACAACHRAKVGYTGPDAAINAAGAVYEGAVPHRFGNRKPPTVAYAGDSPILIYNGTQWFGGMFWDGRATGWTLSDPLAEQAQGPFLNPLEQNNASAQVVVNKVLASNYRQLFLQVCTDAAKRYECIGRAIAAYERSTEVSQFTSRYDYGLKGQAQMTGQEELGRALFMGKANCSNCHVPPNFTDFTYDNPGIPKNPKNPFYAMPPEFNPDGANWVDTGLGGFLKTAHYSETFYMAEWGKHKVPTLRNVDLRPTKHFIKAYGHNGYFKSLEEIVHFYNTRDVPGAGWPSPEVADNINTSEMGNLGLTRREELAIVAFLKTLSDGSTPTPTPTPSPTPPQLYGDVAPRPNGDGSLTAPDGIIERQFVVGLQTPSANEFMRADCAPRATHGDGLLTAGDTIQVRRYIAGLDSIDQLPGTIEARPLNDQSDKAGMKLKSVWTQRVISVVQAEQPPQGKVVLYVQMDRQGDEAAAAFTLGFDPATLSNPVISLGSGASSGTILTTNTSKRDSGQLAVLVDSDEALASGRVVSVTFNVAQNVAGETTPVTFTDAITQGSTADAEGNLLPTRFVDGVLTLPEAASPALEISGRVLTPDGRGLRNAVVVLTDSNGVERYVPTSSFGYYHFDSLTNGATYVIGVKSKRYSFEPRVVQALDNVTDVDFQAR